MFDEEDRQTERKQKEFELKKDRKKEKEREFEVKKDRKKEKEI